MLLGWRKQKPLQQLGGAQLLAVHAHPAGGVLHHIDHLAFPLACQQHLAVLIEVGQFHRGPQLHRAATGSTAAGDHLQEGTLAGAIGADDAHPILRAEVVAEVA